MPDQQMVTYAAGASLAAITLVYVFAPTFFIDGDASSTSASSRKKGIVGLVNNANDCFINSVLQALAGLGDLRLYLIRETHRRKLDGSDVYEQLVPDPVRKGMPAWKIEGLQRGLVTQGLKEILDALNERPIYKKTISPQGFVVILETAFKQRISRQQQDAQEFLQVVAERLCDEYHAGHRARNHAKKFADASERDHASDKESVDSKLNGLALNDGESTIAAPTFSEPDSNTPPQNGNGAKNFEQDDQSLQYDDEGGFPLEGSSESQIECTLCGFKPIPTATTFCSLTLSVPQVSSTSLSSCFDGMFKTEYIEDFKCEKCRLVQALETLKQEEERSTSEDFKIKTRREIEKIEVAIETNPEEEPIDVTLPDRKFAPKRKIAKHVRITKFPKVLAIHLSRSIFDASRSTMKNVAKVSFPERLPLGGLLDQRIYKLSSVVCHKGSHNSGHYESFRRQTVIAPFSTPNTFNTVGVYSKAATPIPSRIPSPQIRAMQRTDDNDVDTSSLSSTPELLSPSSVSSTSLPYAVGSAPSDSHRSINGRPHSISISSDSTTRVQPTSAPRDPDTSSIRSIARSTRSKFSKVGSPYRSVPSTSSSSIKKDDLNGVGPKATTLSSVGDVVRSKRKRNLSNRWWRISDEKIKESKTSEVLGMQREVYMLFYELEKEDET